MTIARTTRAILETTMTPEALLARALTIGRLPARRFRVEDSPIGASRLLPALQADLTAVRYGGRKVELVTVEMFLAAQARQLELRACQRKACGAAAGEPCRSKGGLRKPHACRLDAASRPPSLAEQAKDLAACTECRAAAGAPCVQRSGKARRPHKIRLGAAP